MTKSEFIKEVAIRCGVSSYAVEEVYNVSSNLIAEKLIKDEKIEVPNFGEFILRKKYAKNLFGCEDPAEKECVYPAFKMCNSIKIRVKNGKKYTKSK